MCNQFGQLVPPVQSRWFPLEIPDSYCVGGWDHPIGNPNLRCGRSLRCESVYRQKCADSTPSRVHSRARLPICSDVATRRSTGPIAAICSQKLAAIRSRQRIMTSGETTMHTDNLRWILNHFRDHCMARRHAWDCDPRYDSHTEAHLFTWLPRFESTVGPSRPTTVW